MYKNKEQKSGFHYQDPSDLCYNQACRYLITRLGKGLYKVYGDEYDTKYNL